MIATFAVYSDFFSYRSGVYSYTTGTLAGYHAVLVVGWDDVNHALIVKNSWGTWWGESGYFRIAYSEITGVTHFGSLTLAYGRALHNGDSGTVDLTVSSLTGPPQGRRGGRINLSASVSNAGTGAAGPFRLGFYLSSDSTITTGDTFIGSCAVPGLSAGGTASCNPSLTVPSDLPLGTYYLGAIADDLGQVQESNENNNALAAGQIQISDLSSGINLLSPAHGATFNSCSAYTPPTFAWSSEEAFKSYAIQFSPDSGFSSIPVKATSSAASTQIRSPLWKAALSIPGQTGGVVYWRVVGKRADRTTDQSAPRSFTVDPPGGIGNPTITGTSINGLPAVSWRTSCQNKYKLHFANNPDFARADTKTYAFSFSVEDAIAMGSGDFQRNLTANQWKAAKGLVNGVVGSRIYWYVETWDKMKRKMVTGVMNFKLDP